MGVIAALAGCAVLPGQGPPRWTRISGEPTAAELRMLDWFAGHRDPPLVAASTVRELAAWRGITGLGIRCSFPASHTRAMLRHLEIDYLIVYAREDRCAFASERAGALPVRQFGRGPEAIFLLRAGPAQPAPGG